MAYHQPFSYESFVQYGSSNLGSYQFENQEIMNLPSLLYTFPYITYTTVFEELHVSNCNSK